MREDARQVSGEVLQAAGTASIKALKWECLALLRHGGSNSMRGCVAELRLSESLGLKNH